VPDETVATGRWDSARQSQASHLAYLQPRTCLHCGGDARPRYMYCSDECSTASRAEVLAAYMKKRYGGREG
jgi:hypothetical protein